MDKETVKRRSGLGRGLSAILNDNAYNDLGQATQIPADDALAATAGIKPVAIADIETNPYQPRTEFDREALEELAESIRVQGIIQPITVRQLNDTHFQLISGERRLQASKLAGLTHLPAYIRTANDQEMLEMALIENIQRENLNPMEIAISYQRLISEINLKQEELGDRVGKKRTTVNNYLRLLRLPPDIQAGLRDKKISMGHARALVNVEHVDDQLSIYRRILDQDLSVRKVEDIVRQLHTAEEERPRPKPLADRNAHQIELMRVQNRLSEQFNTRVHLKKGNGESGEIKIPFANTDDLNRILELLRYSE